MPATPTTPTAAPASTGQAPAALLEALAARLGATGFTARLITEPGRLPVLHVTNPAAPQLGEHIYAAPKESGMWLWWSWAEPIAADADEAAARIAQVLRARPGETGSS